MRWFVFKLLTPTGLTVGKPWYVWASNEDEAIERSHRLTERWAAAKTRRNS